MVSKGVIIGIVVVAILIIGGFVLFSGDDDADVNSRVQGPTENEGSNTQVGEEDNSEEPSTDTSGNNEPPRGDSPLWMTAQFNDVNSGETFSVADFSGTPILLESFAVWCPTCTKQQQEIKKLHEIVGEDIISISLDIDPNEDVERVKKHTQDNGFNWRYAVSPIDVTNSLRAEFGIDIIHAPSAPVVLICGDGSFHQLDSGVKKVPELQAEIATCGA